MSKTPHPAWLPPWVNRLALQVALPVSVVAIVLLFGFTDLSVGLVGLLAVGLGGVAYGCAHGVLHRRMKRARSTLRRIRNHNFDTLESVAAPRRDELNHLIWEVYRTGQTLEAEIQELKRMENYRREFIGNVSHELKTPIFSVQGFAETLLDGALEDETVNRSFLEKILFNANRLDNLARDLAEIARIETGELEMSAEPFNLQGLIEEVVESLDMKAEQSDVTLACRCPDDVPRVQGDRERLRQVLVNLADNAIKYNQDGGRVELVARTLPSDEVKVSVVDNGIGIKPEHIPRLTERFYRVDKSRSRNQGGTGLGLAIVKHILGAHDRELMVQSTPGHGSTFGFTLPSGSDAPPPSATVSDRPAANVTVS